MTENVTNTDDRSAAEKRARAKVEFLRHLVIYLFTMSALVAINLLTYPGYYWFVWPMLAWGIGIVGHGVNVFVLTEDSGLYRRMVDRELRHSGH
jgi:predicted membrane channel-forming protein YqfA (hemolysin III family)